ncbi:MAG: hypothetical protein MJ223_00745 [Mycoplasmoidaceae bacterium]|nr:hypothetical protein [Mycoplasmoidaceae bacterium]
MKRNKLFLTIASLSITSTTPLVVLASCNDGQDTKYKVTINLNGGTLDGRTGTISKEVVSGSTYSSLGPPNKEGHTFLC